MGHRRPRTAAKIVKLPYRDLAESSAGQQCGRFISEALHGIHDGDFNNSSSRQRLQAFYVSQLAVKQMLRQKSGQHRQHLNDPG